MNPILRRYFLLTIALFAATGIAAQSNGCNSSYSRFGLGLLSEQSQGFSRGMGGVAQGIRAGNKVNMLNPASYSEIDSLSFIFDAGMNLSSGRLKGNGSTVNVLNASLEYINAGFRLHKGLGMSIGFVPYSSIGYNFNVPAFIGSSLSSKSIKTISNYYGNGGLHELYIGVGWHPFADLSIGANIGYLWGSYNHTLKQAFYESDTNNDAYNSQNAQWSGDLKTYKLDIGAQYPIHIDKRNDLTLGATVTIGHKIGSHVDMSRYTSKGDTINNRASNAFSMPYVISTGASWTHDGRIIVAADYTLQRWQGCKVPMSQPTGDISIATDQYRNMHKMAVGGEYTQDPLGRRYGQRIRYRLGASYSTSYVKVNGNDGPKQLSLTAGVALPLKVTARSHINVSVEWLRRMPSISNQITENYFMAHLGVTFNEAWFMKWKFK